MGRPQPSAEIKTERLVMRKHRLDDTGFMFKTIDQDRERLRRWLPFIDLTKVEADTRRNLEVALEAWESGDMFDYSFFTHQGEFVGRGGIHTINWAIPRGELGYWLAPQAEGKGYATEAMKALEKEIWALGFERLEIRCDPLNSRSAAVPRRLGYTLEAIHRRNSRSNGVLRDQMVWAKLKNDERKSIPKRPSFIGHWSEHLGSDDCHYPDSIELLSHGSPIGHKLGMKAIGIHYEILAPGRRTSWPHAESLEEEFAFVLEGTPDVWIDGVLHRLVPGDFVAFPSGTGIAHTFLNNTSHDCRLLVGGEASKKENRINYPLHPDEMVKRRLRNAAWDDAPKRELGSHDGMTDAIRSLLPSSPEST